MFKQRGRLIAASIASAAMWLLPEAALAAPGAATATSGRASNPAEPARAPDFSGTTLDGHSYALAQRRGRVLVVVLWRSDCRVCLDKLPELRANAQGWAAAPFDLVLINLDPGVGDAATYDRLRRQLSTHETAVHSLWHGQTQLPAAWLASPRLPRTLIVDREGRLVGDHAGRVPADVWNQVADLLP